MSEMQVAEYACIDNDGSTFIVVELQSSAPGRLAGSPVERIADFKRWELKGGGSVNLICHGPPKIFQIVQTDTAIREVG